MVSETTMTGIRLCDDNDEMIWNEYVHGHRESSHYHLFQWGRLIRSCYGHTPYYLMAMKNGDNPKEGGSSKPRHARGRTVSGIFPLIHIKSRIFGNRLVSMPYLDYGGPLADDLEVRNTLLHAALELAIEKNVDMLEMRLKQTIEPQFSWEMPATEAPRPQVANREDKVRMLMDLQESSENLFASFKSKLRSQIRRPTRDGFVASLGGGEHVDAFYDVFASNMRDLGSPVHSRTFIAQVASEFREHARLCLVNNSRQTAAAGFLLRFKDTMYNPWASSLRAFGGSSPNMLLYWKMIESASHEGCRVFDFGRSSVDGGTYKFKKQWGAHPEKLEWYYVYPNGSPPKEPAADSQGFSLAARVWKRLPIRIATVIGPVVRKNISL